MYTIYDDAKDKNVATYVVKAVKGKSGTGELNYLYNEDGSKVKDAELLDAFIKGRLIITAEDHSHCSYPVHVFAQYDLPDDEAIHCKVGILEVPEEGGALEYVWYFTAEATPEPGPAH